MTIGVPKERFEPEIQVRLQKLTRTAKVNGFRPGKIPIRVVEQKFGDQVRSEVLSELLQSSFQEALQQESLRPVSTPNFEIHETQDLEKGFTYTAVFNVPPEIKTLQTDGLPVEKPSASVTENDIDVMLERLRQQRQTWLEVSTPAALNDRVIIDFVGLIDGQPFDGSEVKHLPLVLGQNDMLPGLENALVGVCVGEDREMELTFPTSHKNANLAGQTVHFKVHVESVATAQLPQLDSDFAKSLGVEDGSLSSLRRDARENMQRELEYAIKVRIKQQLLEGLLEANSQVFAPDNLVTEEAERLLKNRQKNLPKELASQMTLDSFKEEAEKRVKLGLLVGELVKRNNLQVNPDKVRQMVERIASTYENPESIVNWYYTDQQRLHEIHSMVIEDEVVEWLLARATVTEVPSDFYSVMAKTSQLTTQNPVRLE
jgi:trigger factor